MALEVNELTASDWVFLTLGAGLTLQKNDKVIFKKDLADRSLVDARGKLSLTDSYTFEFEDGDVNTTNNTIGETAHGMLNGQLVKLRTTGTLPTPLGVDTIYYVVEKADDTFKLSLTSGGAAIDITSAAGGGTHTVVKLVERLQYSNFEIVRA